MSNYQDGILVTRNVDTFVVTKLYHKYLFGMVTLTEFYLTKESCKQLVNCVQKFHIIHLQFN